jgi:hypothetical protein
MTYFRKTYICAHKKKSPDDAECTCLETARLWSDFGTRSKIPDREHDETTNLIEHFFHKVKYTFLQTRIHRRLSDLHVLILQDIIPHYVRDAMMKAVGRVTSVTHKRLNNRDEDVSALLTHEGAITMTNSDIGAASVFSCSKKGVKYQVCLAEMSCTCYFALSKDAICKHLEAVYRKMQYNTVSRTITLLTRYNMF